MKKLNWIFVIIISLTIVACGGKSGKTDDSDTDKISFAAADEYNNFITDQHAVISDKFDEVIVALGTENFTEAKTLQVELEKACKNAVDTLGKLDAYEGNTMFRDAAIKLFTHYRDYAGKGLKEQIELNTKNERTEADDKRIEQIDQEFSKTEEGLYKTLLDAQSKFANDNQMAIQDVTQDAGNINE